MDQVSIVCRRCHLSQRTEEAYRFLIRRSIRFHQICHPRDVGTVHALVSLGADSPLQAATYPLCLRSRNIVAAFETTDIMLPRCSHTSPQAA